MRGGGVSCKSEASPVCIASSRLAKATQHEPVSTQKINSSSVNLLICYRNKGLTTYWRSPSIGSYTIFTA